MHSSFFIKKNDINARNENLESYDKDNISINNSLKRLLQSKKIILSKKILFHKPESFKEYQNFLGFIYNIPKRTEIFS